MTAKRLPWKFEGKKIIVKKSEWNDFVLDIEKRLCADLNKEIENTNKSLRQVLDERDKLHIEIKELRGIVAEVRRCVREPKPK